MQAHGQARPNILLLLTDQQRFDTIQALGSRFAAKTPAMDFLAREGISFDNCFCTAPICSPSRSSLMTGLFPTQAGMPGNLYAPCPPLSPAITTVGNYLRAAGYETVYHGKWHLGGDVKSYGFEKGEECSHDESTRLEASRFWKGRDWIANERPFFHVVSLLTPHDLYFYDPDERVGDFARPWNNVNRNSNGMPTVAAAKRVDWPEAQWGAYTRFYEKMIKRADSDIGEILHQFRCSGFFNNSWIVFASDHGDMAGEHDLPFKGPYMYDGVVRVPLIIVPPITRFLGADRSSQFNHNLTPGRRTHLCSLLDITPTVLDIAGVSIPPHLPGRSLLPAIRDSSVADPHEVVFAHWHQPQIDMARTREWKYVQYQNGDEELYHLTQDPHELKSLALSPEGVGAKRHLRAELDAHLQQTRPK
jgi:arylsulfatase A-like enzyme